MSNIYNILNSAAAAAIAEVLTVPICTIKTNYQTSSGDLINIIKNIYSTGGVRAFYRASGPAVLSQMLSTSSKYSIYRWMDKYSDWKIFNGALSGVLSTLITHPVDFMKIHWQMNQAARPIIAHEGIGVLYRGYSKSFSKALVGSSLFYPLYDWSKNITSNAVSASFISAVISTTIMQPVDYLKTRHIYGNSLWQLNPRVYFRGYGLALIRIVPHFMITMTCIDTLEKNILKGQI